MTVARVGDHEVTHVFALQPGKARRLASSIRWTNQDPGRDQFVGQRLEMPERRREQDRSRVVAGEQRAVLFRGNLHGKLAVVIVGEGMKAKTELLEVVHARSAFGLMF